MIEPNLKRQLDFMESELAKSEWFAGDAFSAADIQMSFPVEAAAQRAGLDASRPKLAAFLKKIHARPAYARRARARRTVQLRQGLSARGALSAVVSALDALGSKRAAWRTGPAGGLTRAASRRRAAVRQRPWLGHGRGHGRIEQGAASGS